ncbi:hypothetical protein LRB11_16565, partial [Ectothiorhodospira haloalkaliphila]|nr:hypothetical protein [Ectothiorhodospira haloalkaliphila]
EHQMPQGLMVSRLDWQSGDILDAVPQVSAIGWFVTAAGNGYRSGNAFDRPGAWEDDPQLAERSRALYDTLLHHNAWLLKRLD